MDEINSSADKNYFKIDEISLFLDHNSFAKIINKLTDYAEILSEGKLIGIINNNFRLNSLETDILIDLLIGTNGISKIYSMALKGSRDLEVEYISNIFSNLENFEIMPSYVSLKTLLENRITHLVPQYNMNRSKHTTTQTMPVTEIRMHSKTYIDLSSTNQPVATKTQHGIIAASLHDAYVTLLNRHDWWNNKIYMKFFFNTDEFSIKNKLILTHEPPVPLEQVKTNLQDVLDALTELKKNKAQHTALPDNSGTPDPMLTAKAPGPKLNHDPKEQIDRIQMTPFGKQYGAIIDKVINRIFNIETVGENTESDTDQIHRSMLLSFQMFCENQDSFNPGNDDELAHMVKFLIHSDYTVKSYSERHLFTVRRDGYNKFSGQMKNIAEAFFEKLFTIFIELSFSHLFRFIQSTDTKKFAYAYIIKRIYMLKGEQLENFGYFFLKVVAKIGGIRQS